MGCEYGSKCGIKGKAFRLQINNNFRGTVFDKNLKLNAKYGDFVGGEAEFSLEKNLTEDVSIYGAVGVNGLMSLKDKEMELIDFQHENGEVNVTYTYEDGNTESYTTVSESHSETYRMTDMYQNTMNAGLRFGAKIDGNKIGTVDISVGGGVNGHFSHYMGEDTKFSTRPYIGGEVKLEKPLLKGAVSFDALVGTQLYRNVTMSYNGARIVNHDNKPYFSVGANINISKIADNIKHSRINKTAEK